MKLGRALFLDRDGIINEDKHYVTKIEDVVFIEGILELVKYFQDKGFLVLVVTNQSGVARGLMTLKELHAINTFIRNFFKKNALSIEEIFFCPHHPEFSGKCYCRKPQPGMIIKAKKKYDLDLTNSVMFGDRITDMEAANTAGIGLKVLIRGLENKTSTKKPLFDMRFDAITNFNDLINKDKFIDR